MANIEKITRFLIRKFNENGIVVEKIILFGSRANRTANPSSDYDFAIISPAFDGMDLYERAKLTSMIVAETIWKFDVPIDLVELTPDEFQHRTSLIAEYVSAGKILTL